MNVNALKDGMSCLHRACNDGNLEAVHVLLECGADINLMSGKEAGIPRTPFHYACEKGHLEVVKCLVEHKADIYARDGHKWTGFHTACEKGRLSVVEYLFTTCEMYTKLTAEDMKQCLLGCKHSDVVKYVVSELAR